MKSRSTNGRIDLLPQVAPANDGAHSAGWKDLPRRVASLGRELGLRGKRSKGREEQIMNVSDLMHRTVVTCTPRDSLHRAAQLMWDEDVGALPVVDDGGHLVGMITDRDICMAAYTRGTSLPEVTVGAAMASHVFTCLPGDSLEHAESLMRAQQIRRVPVIDGENTPIGMLSLNDLARHADASRWRQHEEHALIHTLAAITQPREAAPGRGGIAQA